MHKAAFARQGCAWADAIVERLAMREICLSTGSRLPRWLHRSVAWISYEDAKSTLRANLSTLSKGGSRVGNGRNSSCREYGATTTALEV
ncbi:MULTISPECIES: hypothetical protein [unclassified Mesorhizobium]|uniref:hypothetical protein n=1 Tax=unclassified Mesorhizobium TaxID=325217 RepID=UPI00192897A8